MVPPEFEVVHPDYLGAVHVHDLAVKYVPFYQDVPLFRNIWR